MCVGWLNCCCICNAVEQLRIHMDLGCSKVLEIMYLFFFVVNTGWGVDLDRNNRLSSPDEAVWSSIFLRSQ